MVFYQRKWTAIRLLTVIFRVFFCPCPLASPYLWDSANINMVTINDKTFVPFLSAQAIQTRIQELANTINKDYADKQPLIVIVLNGAFIFAADLVKRLTIPCEITFIRVASYTAAESSGRVKQILGLTDEIAGRDLILVEDIVDTGLTINEVCAQLWAKEPASLAITTLLFKPAALKKPLDLHYVGFEIENRFVLGYGLDYDGLGRNTEEILVLE